MNRLMLALAAAVTLTAGTMATANAFEVGVGPGGVHVGPGYYHHRGYDDGGCRVIVTHRYNRFGDRVMVRRRVCD
ncbi:MAG: hypothetical protein ACREDL_21390 [Bradyrhizobium sp.]